jgi:hypothetical protein
VILPDPSLPKTETMWLLLVGLSEYILARIANRLRHCSLEQFRTRGKRTDNKIPSPCLISEGSQARLFQLSGSVTETA